MSSLHLLCCCQSNPTAYLLFRASSTQYEIVAIEDIGSSGVISWSSSYSARNTHQGQLWHYNNNIYCAIPTTSPDHNIYKIRASDGSTIISKYYNAPTDQTELDKLGLCVSEDEEIFVVTQDTPVIGVSMYKLDSSLEILASGSVNDTQPTWNGEDRPTAKSEGAGAHRTMSIQEGGQPCWGNLTAGFYSAHRLNNDLSPPAFSSSHWRVATDNFNTEAGKAYAPNIFIGGATVIIPVEDNPARAKTIPSYSTFTASSYDVIRDSTRVGTFACNGTASSGNIWGCTDTHLWKKETNSGLQNPYVRYSKKLGTEDFMSDISWGSAVYMNLLRYTNGDLWISIKDPVAPVKHYIVCYEQVGASGLNEKWRIDLYNHPDSNVTSAYQLVNWCLNCEGNGYDNPTVITWG